MINKNLKCDYPCADILEYELSQFTDLKARDG